MSETSYVLCLGPFFHDWDKWQDGVWTYKRLLTLEDGVPCEQWGTTFEYKREGQTRTCKDCGRKQTRML